jgi:hypothetical protein
MYEQKAHGPLHEMFPRPVAPAPAPPPVPAPAPPTPTAPAAAGFIGPAPRTADDEIERWIAEFASGEVHGASEVSLAVPPVATFREALDAVDVSRMSAADGARFEHGWARYSQNPSARIKSKDDYIRFRYGKENNLLPRVMTTPEPMVLPTPPGGRLPSVDIAMQAGREVEKTQTLLRNTPKNNQRHAIAFEDPVRQKTVTITVIPDFMPTSRTDASGGFITATNPADAVLIADSKFTWDAAGQIAITDQIRGMIALAKENEKPFVFLVAESATISPGIREFADAIGAEVHVVQDVSGLIR